MNALCKTVLIAVLVVVLVPPAPARESREQKQARLDAACEVAREKQLKPMREKFIAECVDKEQLPSLEDCTRFYADYGGRMGNRPPLFYDLPECVTAFDYRQSARSPD
jgi:hypothetical protein